MISTLDHANKDIAAQMWAVFQASYAVEAELLKTVDFPPLKRTVDDFLTSDTQFFGFWAEQELAAVIEIRMRADFIHIQSLVVHPTYFRRGIGRALMNFVLAKFQTDVFMVETGVNNAPAITLYEGFGFKEVKQWDTDHGVRKVRFERRS
jgi:ribosomal protein S18 acetylase RimI-like enzyme